MIDCNGVWTAECDANRRRKVSEQASVHAGDGGFDIHVKGNTDLTGAVISGTADASKNSLTTGTLTFSDIQNQSHYDASSNGIGVGVGIGATGKAAGPGSVSNGGGVSPMLRRTTAATRPTRIDRELT